MDRDLTLAEVSRRLRVGEDKIVRWIHLGELVGSLVKTNLGDDRRKNMKRWIVTAASLAEFERRRSSRQQGAICVERLTNCARCGENHDRGLCFVPIVGTPIPGATHWATCPATGQPILMRVEGVPDAL